MPKKGVFKRKVVILLKIRVNWKKLLKQKVSNGIMRKTESFK